MIKKIPIHPLTRFEKLYLEAPESKKAKKPKVIEIDMDNTEGLGDDVELDTSDEDMDVPEDDTEGGDDIVLDDDMETEEPSGEEDAGDDVELDDEGDSADTSEGDGSGADDVVLDDSEIGDEEATADDSGDEETVTAKDNNSDDVKEAVKKQRLYESFLSLHNCVKNYIDKMDRVVGIDDNFNKEYMSINERLKRLRGFLYDYMVIKFKGSSYVQSLLFYQRAVATVNMCLNVIEDIRKREGMLEKKKPTK